MMTETENKFPEGIRCSSARWAHKGHISKSCESWRSRPMNESRQVKFLIKASLYAFLSLSLSPPSLRILNVFICFKLLLLKSGDWRECACAPATRFGVYGNGNVSVSTNRETAKHLLLTTNDPTTAATQEWNLKFIENFLPFAGSCVFLVSLSREFHGQTGPYAPRQLLCVWVSECSKSKIFRSIRSDEAGCRASSTEWAMGVCVCLHSCLAHSQVNDWLYGNGTRTALVRMYSYIQIGQLMRSRNLITSQALELWKEIAEKCRDSWRLWNPENAD